MYGRGDGIPEVEGNPCLPVPGWLVSKRQVQRGSSFPCTHYTALNHLDLILNTRKSMVVPTLKIEFIGAILDSTSLSMFLPTDHLQMIYHLCLSQQCQPSTTVQIRLRLLGHMSSRMQVVQFARLRLHPLQMWLQAVYRPTIHCWTCWSASLR